jgi:hypothetical protein
MVRQNNSSQLLKITKQTAGLQDLSKAHPPFPNWRRKKDAAFEMAGGDAIIGKRAYPKAALRAVLGVREPLVYFITGVAAHLIPISNQLCLAIKKALAP